MHFKNIALSILLILVSMSGQSQDPQRFQKEIDDLKSSANVNSDSLLLFTGSSSIRMWKTLQNYFEAYQTINNGFGGSHMSDLLYYSDILVDAYDPDVIFIYEGDNDVAAGKSKREIIKSTKKLLRRIKKRHPECPIVLIAAKPSPLRWEFKNEYEELNSYFAKTASRKKMIYYADVWTPMLGEDGEVIKELFIQDDLHMNEDGYIIWGKVLNDLIKVINE